MAPATSPSNLCMSGPTAIRFLILTASIRRGARLTAPCGTAYYAAQREGRLQSGTKTRSHSSGDPSSAPTSDRENLDCGPVMLVAHRWPKVIVIVIAPQ